MKITLAEKSDFAPVLDLVQRVAGWLKQEQMKQWEEFLTGDGPDLLMRRFQEGEVYIAQDGRRIVGVIVIQWEDGFWGERGSDETAAYVHTMAVERDWAGRGVGAALMAQAELRAAEEGRRYIRLDCGKENSKLCGYYESHGFKKVGEKQWDDWTANLYQKDLGTE
jgi:ribosomal protein S18 acetylase RimI-like enzyme